MKKLFHIAIEGPIGAGKTTLAKLMAKDLNAHLVLEEADENPFLGRFYDQPDQYAFQAQMFFLLSRYKQLTKTSQPDLFHRALVCDYIMMKDYLFAHLNLADAELEIYRPIFELLSQKLVLPDLVIFLQADRETLFKRMQKRNKTYEKGLTLDYLDRLIEAYSQFFFQYKQTPLLIVNTSGLDFVDNQANYELLKKEIYQMWKQGKAKHYVSIDNR